MVRKYEVWGRPQKRALRYEIKALAQSSNRSDLRVRSTCPSLIFLLKLKHRFAIFVFGDDQILAAAFKVEG